MYDPIAQSDTAESLISDSENETFTTSRARRSNFASYLKRSIITVAVLAFYTIAVVRLTLKGAREHRRVGRRFLDTPVDNDYIVYDAKVMGQWEDEGQQHYVEYFGEPSEEIDRNWHNIVAHSNLGIKEEEMRALGRENEGIKLPDGTYFGSIMVFHHLHCLVEKNLYHALHPEYYGLANLTGVAKAELAEHTTFEPERDFEITL
ncbi:hypothetical protein ACEQ8H_006952 [Pleosporales sp. CAS-2024a]